jgi:hypothetical protein
VAAGDTAHARPEAIDERRPAPAAGGCRRQDGAFELGRVGRQSPARPGAAPVVVERLLVVRIVVQHRVTPLALWRAIRRCGRVGVLGGKLDFAHAAAYAIWRSRNTSSDVFRAWR